jgi:CheY-like chemotaxis protein
VKKSFHVLLADDDKDDQFLFSKAIAEMSMPVELTVISNGEKLMHHLSEHLRELPDVVFLDLNMPRKSGAECLTEICSNKRLQHLPIIIFSTYLHKDILDLFYKYGAFYCIRKTTDPEELRDVLGKVFSFIENEETERPSRERFVLNFS